MKQIISKFMDRQPAKFVVSGFLILIFSGAVLLMFPFASRSGEFTPFYKTLFTATSATCVTGLTVIDAGTYLSFFGQLILLLLIQVGGLGFMSLAALVSLAFRRTISIRERLLLAEAVNQNGISGILRLIRFVLKGTFLCEGVGAALLAIRFVPEYGFFDGIWKSVFHSVSAFCNAGFDIMGKNGPSLSAYATDPLVNLVIMALIILGGLGFLVWEGLLSRRSPKKWRLHTKLVLSVTGALLLGGWISYAVLEWSNPATLGQFEGIQKLLPAAFLSVTMRTAGFYTVDLTGLGMIARAISLILMFIGGSPGSTAGGVKTSVFGIMALTLFSVLRGRNYVNAFRRRITSGTMMRAVTVVMLGGIFVCAGTFAVIGMENIANALNPTPTNVLFEVVSAFATVGLSLNLTANLCVPSLLVLCVMMFVGRVGIFTVLMSLLLKHAETEEHFSYPEERILIG